MEGYWQSERYFSDYADLIENEISPPIPQDERFTAMAKRMDGSNSVAVGVRLFEEVPKTKQTAIYAFYTEAAVRLAEKVKDPVFFVFCTKESIRGKLTLPGEVHYLTRENGYVDEMNVMWLISKCAHHIISNSSFYWWGTWLAERKHRNSVSIACDTFENADCIPPRWISIPHSF